MAEFNIESARDVFDGISLDTSGAAPMFSLLAGPLRLRLDMSEARQCHTELGERLAEATELLKGQGTATVISKARVEEYRLQFARRSGSAGELPPAAPAVTDISPPDAGVCATNQRKTIFENAVKIGEPGNGIFHGTVAQLAIAIGWDALDHRTMRLANAIQAWTFGPRTAAPAEMLLDQIAALPAEDFAVAAKFIIRCLATHSLKAQAASL